MDVQTSKIELAKLILNIENPAILKRIKDIIIHATTDSSALTPEQSEEIRLAIATLDKGQKLSFEDFLKKVS